MKKLFLLCLLLMPAVSFAQSYQQILSDYPGAIVTQVTGKQGFIFDAPDVSATVIGRYGAGRSVVAYKKIGAFYAVATPDDGHAGYIISSQLDVPQDPDAPKLPMVRRAEGYKDPLVARQMGYALPGGGHFYTGETVKGVLLLGASAGGFMGGYALTQRSRTFDCAESAQRCEESKDYTGLLVGSAVALGAWAYGILDAAGSARRANAQAGITATAAPVPVEVDGKLRAGLAMRFTW